MQGIHSPYRGVSHGHNDCQNFLPLLFAGFRLNSSTTKEKKLDDLLQYAGNM